MGDCEDCKYVDVKLCDYPCTDCSNNGGNEDLFEPNESECNPVVVIDKHGLARLVEDVTIVDLMAVAKLFNGELHLRIVPNEEIGEE